MIYTSTDAAANDTDTATTTNDTDTDELPINYFYGYSYQWYRYRWATDEVPYTATNDTDTATATTDTATATTTDDTDTDELPMRYPSRGARNEHFLDYLREPPGGANFFRLPPRASRPRLHYICICIYIYPSQRDTIWGRPQKKVQQIAINKAIKS